MKLPEVDLKELEQQKNDNFQQRLHFIDQYVSWLKKLQIKNGVNNKKN